MRCPFCSHEDTQVKDSRPAKDNAAIRRRRFCPVCGTRFTTFERMQLHELHVMKKGGQRVLFDHKKLARSIRIAVRKRPVTDEQIEGIVTSIQRYLEGLGENELSSARIGEMVMNALRDLDQVAYIRFASVYKNFCRAWDFKAFVETLGRDK